MNKIRERESANPIRKLYKKHRCKIIIATFFIVFAFLFNNYTVVGDGISHYILLESLIQDRDLVSSNQIEKYRAENKSMPASFATSFGTAIFNAPFYLISMGLDNFFLFQKKIIMDNRGVLNITINTASINVASNFYTLISLMLSLGILSQLGLKRSPLVILAVLISTPLLYYSVLVSSLNHAINTFLITLFVYLFLYLRKRPPAYQCIIGILLAVSITVRYFNIALAVFLFCYYLVCRDKERLKYFSLSFLGIFSILILILSVQYKYGVLFKHILELFNATLATGQRLFIYPRYFFHLLFSPVHGLFLWSPVTLLATIGLYYFYKQDRKLALFFTGIFFSMVYAYGLFSAWHGSWSFSIRYLTCLFPVFVVGLTFFISKHRKWGLGLIVLFTAYSFFLMFNHFLSVMHSETGTPLDMVRVWASGEMNLKKFLVKVYDYSIVNNIVRFLRLH